MTFSTIGSIATFIVDTIGGLSTGVSGNMLSIVDSNRQHVANFVGEMIGSNDISAEFEPPIVSLSKADAMDFMQGQAGGEKISLGDLSIDDSGESMSSESWRKLAQSQLDAIGRKSRFARSLS